MRNRANKLGFLAPMKVGVVKEIKSDEYRVALTPAGARELVERGHDVLVERGAGVEREVTKPAEAYGPFPAWPRCRYREGSLPEL